MKRKLQQLGMMPRRYVFIGWLLLALILLGAIASTVSDVPFNDEKRWIRFP